MNFLVLVITIFGFLAADVQAQAKLKVPGHMAFFSCNNILTDDYTFGSGSLEYYVELCQYAPALGTSLHCVSQLASGPLNVDPEKLLNQTYSILYDYCPEYGGISVNYTYFQSVYDNATKYLVDYTSLKNASETLYFPITLNQTTAYNGYLAYNYFYDNYDMSNIYGGIILAYWGIVMFSAAIVNLLVKTRLISHLNNAVINSFRAHFTIKPLFSKDYARSLKFGNRVIGILATRLETVIIFVYLIVHVLVLCFRYSYDGSNTLFTSKEMQSVRYISDRTGIIAFAHIPLIILFGGRNNIFQWLTGFSHSSFIQFHKWTGRVMFIDSLIHSAGYTKYFIMYGSLMLEYLQVYIQMGIAATIISGLTVLFSFHFFRNNRYELFLFLHIVFGAFFLWTCWEHCLDIGWMEWLYASAAIWCFDRFLRLVRLAIFGSPVAKVELCMEDTIRITVPSNHSLLTNRSRPGQYCFVYFLTPTMFWQSHPFTVMDSIHNEHEFVMYMKVKRGLTSRLAKRLAKLPGRQTTMRVSLEGPYGQSSPCTKYDNSLLLAAGNGISGPMDHAIKLSKPGNPSRGRIVLIWVARTLQTIEYMVPDLILLNGTKVEVHVYLTRETLAPDDAKTGFSEDESSSAAEAKVEDKEAEKGIESEEIVVTEKTQAVASTGESTYKQLKKFVQFHQGRPDLEKLVGTIVAENGTGSTVVVSCGPDRFCGAVRLAVADCLGSTRGMVDLHQEMQLW